MINMIGAFYKKHSFSITKFLSNSKCGVYISYDEVFYLPCSKIQFGDREE